MKPILFSASMVNAIRAGAKTQTRRLVTEEWAPGFVRSEAWGYTKRPLQRESGRDDFVTRSDVYSLEAGEPVWFYSWGNSRWLRCLYGGSGDHLWVRETWATEKRFDRRKPSRVPKGSKIWYLADGPKPKWAGRSRPSIFMLAWMSRIELAIENVRVERVTEISEYDARAEGALRWAAAEGDRIGQVWTGTAREAFANLWESINAKRASWFSQPWVWALDFSVVRGLR